ncbi:MAG: mandelate racemase, partial [Chloroflexi bacterium]|nr:mandelate racemase [Chloroflexota bacterium]
MSSRIVRIEWAELEGERPRTAGCNARLGAHGKRVRASIARVSTDDGAAGFGWAAITESEALALIGRPLSEAFDGGPGVAEGFRAIEYPLLDLEGKLAGVPVYSLVAREPGRGEPFRVRCYDTSLYMDDLHLADDGQAAALIASEAREGLARGHRHFKLKVGRGAMHMPLEEGTRRDI